MPEAGQFIAPGNRVFTHGQKYRVVAGNLQGEVVRCIDRYSFAVPANDTDVGVKLQDGTDTYINSWYLDNFPPGMIDYNEPIRPGFPF